MPLLLEAFFRIAERYDLYLRVAGRGKLDARTARLAEHPRVRVDNRWIPESELALIFASCDLVVAPYVEASQSGVVAAAYGMGLPVVVTPVGGLREQVISGETGVIADETTPQALADAIERLTTDRALFRKCCEGARLAGRIDDTWNAIARQMARVLYEVWTRANGGSEVDARGSGWFG